MKGNRAKVVLVNALLITLGLALVEMGARALGFTPEPPLSRTFGRGYYPRSYFVAHPTHGFDIRPSVPPTPFTFADATVDVFSNRYGCFDRNESFEGPYVLLLGDSFAWGYAAYDQKWGTLVEKKIGVPVAKCGVTHTGQRHQLEKGKSVVAAVGHAPRLVIVSYYDNDPEDDLLFPQATVIDGYLADEVVIESGAVRRYTRAEIEARYARWQRGEAGLKNVGDDMPATMKLIHRMRESSVIADAFLLGASRVGAKLRPSAEKEALDALQRRASTQNHEAIAAIAEWTDAMGASLLFVLVPGRGAKKGTYADLRSYLTERGIAYLDLVPVFAATPNRRSLFWQHDPHWSAAGNQVAGDAVAAVVRRQFGDLLAR